VATLQKLIPQLEASVEPVYIFTPGQINLSTDFMETGTIPVTERYRPAAEKALNEILKDLPLPNLLPAHVITSEVSSSNQAAELLSRYSLERGAEAILVSSHGRSGLGRLLLGSFAETLVLRSEVPLVIVHPHFAAERKYGSEEGIKRILFPTDFGHLSEASFRKTVELAKTFGAKVTLFHSVPYPFEPVLQSGVYLLGGGWMPIHAYLGNEVQRRQRRAEAWARWAKNQKSVEVDPMINSEGGSISELILDLAREQNADLISMAAQSGPIASAIIGSVTRQVIRHAPTPVWVLRFPKPGARLGRPAEAA
jgi:nucleotide-binding universal stress UspA family protein